MGADRAHPRRKWVQLITIVWWMRDVLGGKSGSQALDNCTHENICVFVSFAMFLMRSKTQNWKRFKAKYYAVCKEEASRRVFPRLYYPRVDFHDHEAWGGLSKTGSRIFRIARLQSRRSTDQLRSVQNIPGWRSQGLSDFELPECRDAVSTVSNRAVQRMWQEWLWLARLLQISRNRSSARVCKTGTTFLLNFWRCNSHSRREHKRGR